MEHKLYEYDFDKFKKAEKPTIDSSRLASPEAKIDIFSEFEELDDIDNSYESISLTKSIQDEPISALENLINEDEPKKETINEEVEEFNQTKEITPINDKVLENLDLIINEKKEIETLDINEKPLKKEPMSLASAFINCSILGFITTFWGYGVFFYIMSHI